MKRSIKTHTSKINYARKNYKIGTAVKDANELLFNVIEAEILFNTNAKGLNS